MFSLFRLLSLFIVVSFVITVSGLYAEIELPLLISDHMVMQRQEPIPVRGWCETGSEIEVEFTGEKVSTRSDGNGAWNVLLNPREAGGPYVLHVRCGEDTRTVRDILIGDVWLCSGQSNMEFILRNAENAGEEIANSENSQIRHFQVPKSWDLVPSDRLFGGSWKTAGPDTAGDFTAIGYYFAKRIQAETGIPIGLLHSSWGGSNIESWMSPAALGETDEEAGRRMQQLAADAELRAESIKKKLSRWPEALTSGTAGMDADWSGADVDERDWMEIHAPQLWEMEGLEGVDGVIWYRKTFHLDEKQAASGIILGLARIDDNDTTWVNGHKIGETRAYDQVRRYNVPARFLESGENRIAVRVEDTGGGGGIYSDPDLLSVETADGGKISLAGMWKIKPEKVSVSMMTDANHIPTALYNKMIHPLMDFPVRGVLWYQGETNADTLEQAQKYSGQFQNLIQDWRKRWHEPEMAFYWVQLANFNSGLDTASASPWAILREAQTAALILPNTGQAITIDVGNPNDIHPRDKKTVGTRLARIALNKAYGKTDLRYQGPIPENALLSGSTVVVHFTDTESGLTTAGAGEVVSGFEIAGEEGKFQPAAATIRNNTVIVKNESVERPATVRYAWKDNPEEANLVGADGLPAGPFRLSVER